MSSAEQRVTQMEGGGGEEEGEESSGPQLADHSYIRSPANPEEDEARALDEEEEEAEQEEEGGHRYVYLQPAQPGHSARYTYHTAVPQVGENVEIKSSVQEEGAMNTQDGDDSDVKPNLTELAVAGDSDGRYQYVWALQQQHGHIPALQQQKLKTARALYMPPISLVKESVKQEYDRAMEDKNIILGLIYQLPVEDVPYNVTHEDLVKALSTANDKVSVRVMRRTLPCLRIVAYMKKEEFVGKKKIKGLWNQKPTDWHATCPYKDPNNGEKINGTPIPKANSNELRQMFAFLKNKFMANIKNEIETMSEEDKAAIQVPTAQVTSNMAAMDTGSAAAHERRAAKRHATSQHAGQQVATGSSRAGAQQIEHSRELPLFVQGETFQNNLKHAEENEEEEIEEDEGGVTYEPPASDQSEALFQNQTQYTLVDTYDEPQGGAKTIVQLNEQGYIKSEVPDQVLYTAEYANSQPGPEFQQPPAKLSRSQIQDLSSEAAKQVLRQDSNSSRQGETKKPVVIQPSSGEGHGVFASVKGIDSTAAGNHITSSPALQPSYRPGFGGQSMTQPAGQSMFAAMQQQGNMYIVNDLFQRQKEKIMYLQNLTLGDEEISSGLSRLYSQVIQSLYSKACMDSRHGTTFIQGAHKSEALLDKAMLDGKKLPRQTFIEEVNAIIQEHGNPNTGKEQNMTVFNATAGVLPADAKKALAAKQAAALMSPKSPGTFLGKEFAGLSLEKPVKQDAPSQGGLDDKAVRAMSGSVDDLAEGLGIRKKKEGTLDGFVEKRSVVQQPAGSEEQSMDLDGKDALEKLNDHLNMVLASVQEQQDATTADSSSENVYMKENQEIVTQEDLHALLEDIANSEAASALREKVNDPMLSATLVLPAEKEVLKLKGAIFPEDPACEAKQPGAELADISNLDLDEVLDLKEECNVRSRTMSQPGQVAQFKVVSNIHQPSAQHSDQSTFADQPCVPASNRVVAEPMFQVPRYNTPAPAKTQQTAGKARPAHRSHGTKAVPYSTSRGSAGQQPSTAVQTTPKYTFVNPKNPSNKLMQKKGSGSAPATRFAVGSSTSHDAQPNVFGNGGGTPNQTTSYFAGDYSLGGTSGFSGHGIGAQGGLHGAQIMLGAGNGAAQFGAGEGTQGVAGLGATSGQPTQPVNTPAINSAIPSVVDVAAMEVEPDIYLDRTFTAPKIPPEK